MSTRKEESEKKASPYFDVKSLLNQVISNIDELFLNKKDVTGIPTGFIEIDKMLAGLQPSNLIVIASRPVMGKTSFVLNIVANATIGSQINVGIFSLEMPREQLVTRLISSEGKIDSQALRTGKLNNDEYSKISKVACVLSETKIYIDDSSGISIELLCERSREMKTDKNIQLIVVDYFQLIDSKNELHDMDYISKKLKSLAKELKIPIIVLSQLSSESEDRPNKTPFISDLPGSGSLADAADVVLFVFREEVYKENDPLLRGLAEIIIAKQRNGPIGRVPLTFQKEFTLFTNYEGPGYG
jgi:replicative DNA helicase